MLPNFNCCIFLRDLPFFEYTILDWVQSHWPGWICVPSVKMRMPRQIEWESVLGKHSNTVRWIFFCQMGTPPPPLADNNFGRFVGSPLPAPLPPIYGKDPPNSISKFPLLKTYIYQTRFQYFLTRNFSIHLEVNFLQKLLSFLQSS